MKSARHGTRTSAVEVTNVSQHGFWLFLGDRELFLPFDQFPWFKDAPIGKIMNVQRLQPHHLYWPDLDVDIAVDSIDHPSRYPLVSRQQLGTSSPGRNARNAKPRNRVSGADSGQKGCVRFVAVIRYPSISYSERG